MLAIKASIIKYISNDQPGFVECAFKDAWGKEHIVHEKVPIVTDKDLHFDSNYPQDAVLNCEVIKEIEDKDGRKIILVTTAKPWGIETIEGLEEFELLEDQIMSY